MSSSYSTSDLWEHLRTVCSPISAFGDWNIVLRDKRGASSPDKKKTFFHLPDAGWLLCDTRSVQWVPRCQHPLHHPERRFRIPAFQRWQHMSLQAAPVTQQHDAFLSHLTLFLFENWTAGLCCYFIVFHMSCSQQLCSFQMCWSLVCSQVTTDLGLLLTLVQLDLPIVSPGSWTTKKERTRTPGVRQVF